MAGTTSAALQTPKYVDWLSAERVIETGLKLTKSNKIHADTKRLLATHNDDWTEALQMPKKKPTTSGEKLVVDLPQTHI